MSEILYTVSGDISVLPKLVATVCQHLQQTPVLLLKGNLGAGKTTLSQAVLKTLGVLQQVSSPTFNIVNTYSDAEGNNYYHFDLYRIKHFAELEDLGFFDYIDSARPCLIEWPEIIEEHLQEPHLLLDIRQLEDQRAYTLSRL